MATMPKMMTKIDKATAREFAESAQVLDDVIRMTPKHGRSEMCRKDGGKIIVMRSGCVIRFWTYGY